MCGIYGAIEHGGNAAAVVFAGLKDLEYRGYDSWGLAYTQNGTLTIKKDVGLLPSGLDLPLATLALGHTRWATNGKVTRENAHPHADCHQSLALVHNGIVENVVQFKNELSDHQFTSETDSEVVAHLIEAERNSYPFSEAVRRVFARLQGSNALLVSDGKALMAIKDGSSLVVGRTSSGFVVSSDANTLLPYTRELYFPQDKELVALEDGLDVNFIPVRWVYQSASLNEHPHFMIKEICEEPLALERLLKDPQQIREAAKIFENSQSIFLLGCGSAYYAGLCADYLLSTYGKRLAYCCSASEFATKQALLSSQDLIVGISQSGETIDLLEEIRHSKKKGVNQLAVVNAFGSALYREVPSRIMLKAGVEKAVVATKSFINMVGAFILLSSYLGRDFKKGEEIIKKSIEGVQRVLEHQEEIKELSRDLAGRGHLFILGRGMSLPISLETALKIKEAACLPAEAFSGGELKHGVLALVEEGVPIIAFTSEGTQGQDILCNISEAKARGAEIIGVGSTFDHSFDHYFPIPETGADSIIPKATFGQLLGYHLALRRGYNPDKPRNLAKSVTVK